MDAVNTQPIWQQLLAALDERHRPILLQLIARLSRHFGEFRLQNVHGLAEPDGYDGMSQRGHLQQLLISQWALLDAYPDEFLRRAAIGELLYLQPKRLENKEGRRCRVVVDTSLATLGSPRIVQLAALIVLQRRAETVGADFEWSIAQRPEFGWMKFEQRQAMETFMEARSMQLLADDFWQGWAVRWEGAELEAEQRDPLSQQEEIWWLGHPDNAPTAVAVDQFSHQVNLQQITIDQMQLYLKGTQRAGAMQLPLPAEEQCVALLRNPFLLQKRDRPQDEAPLTVLKHRLAEQAAIGFSPDGRRLVVELDDGGLLHVPLPNSPRAKPGRAKVMPGKGQWLGIGFYGKELLALDSAERLCLRSKARVWQQRSEPTPSSLLTADNEPSVVTGNLASLGTLDMASYLPVVQGGVLSLYRTENLHRRKMDIDEVRWSGFRGRDFIFAHGADQRTIRFRMLKLVGKDTDQCQVTGISSGVNRAHIQAGGSGQVVANPCWGAASKVVFAVHTNAHYWEVLGAGPVLRLKVETADQVFGVVALEEDMPALLVVNDQQRVELVSKRQRQPVSLPIEQVAKVCFNPVGRQFVALSAHLQLVVYSVPRRQVVARFDGRAEDLS